MVGIVDQSGRRRRHLALRSERDDARPERSEMEIGRARAGTAVEDESDRPTLGVRLVARIGDVVYSGLPLALVFGERQGRGRGGEGDARIADLELVMGDGIGRSIERRGVGDGNGGKEEQRQHRTAQQGSHRRGRLA